MLEAKTHIDAEMIISAAKIDGLRYSIDHVVLMVS